MKRISRPGLAALAGVLTLTLSGCGLGGGVYDVPLPGGADIGDDPMTITADFADVLDLVPQSSVKVDSVPVGRVSDIELNDDGQSAHVTLLVNQDADLPAGTVARLQQTSLLGEKYVALLKPTKPVTGEPVSSGTNLGLAKTSQAAEVEQVLGALSLVLNGGGIEKFQKISRELQNVSTGRPEEIKGFLRQMDGFVSGLDTNKEAITDALDGLGKLSKTLRGDKEKISNALQELSPGMQVIVDQRKQLVKMLSSLDRLSKVTVSTLNKAQDDIVADFKLLDPILDQLAKSGSDLPNSLQILLTYPFPDSVLDTIEGDYLNVFITTNFHTLPADCVAMGCAWPQVPGTTTPSSLMRSVDPGLVPPTLLPPTDSVSPGIPDETVTVPTDPADPSGDSSPSSGTSPSGPTGPSGPSGPSHPTSPTGRTNPTTSGSATGNPSTQSGDE
ncbi:MAG: MCE family protein [Nocardioides sp.]|nr:MCE family protein [Nocardioides sp.]